MVLSVRVTLAAQSARRGWGAAWFFFVLVRTAVGCTDAPSSFGPRDAQPVADDGDAAVRGDASLADAATAEDGTAAVDVPAVRRLGAPRCDDAPTVEPDGVLDAPEGDGPFFVRVRVPPRSAVGLLARPDVNFVLACADCADFESASLGDERCRSSRVPPLRREDTPAGPLWRRAGRPLAVNPSDTPGHVVVAMGRNAGVVSMALRSWPLETPSAREPCTPTELDGARALASSPPCGVQTTLPTWSTSFLFGLPGFTHTRDNLDALPRVEPIATAGGPVAMWTLPLPGADCAAPLELVPGAPVTLRVDSGTPGASALCVGAMPTTLGVRYLAVAVPPRSRAVVTASACVIADGGGYAILRRASRCDGAAVCADEVAQAWRAGAPPARMVVDNPSETAILARLSVHQGGVGYTGNEMRLEVGLERL